MNHHGFTYGLVVVVVVVVVIVVVVVVVDVIMTMMEVALFPSLSYHSNIPSFISSMMMTMPALSSSNRL